VCHHQIKLQVFDLCRHALCVTASLVKVTLHMYELTQRQVTLLFGNAGLQLRRVYTACG
jgi:hypothetical protein